MINLPNLDNYTPKQLRRFATQVYAELHPGPFLRVADWAALMADAADLEAAGKPIVASIRRGAARRIYKKLPPQYQWKPNE